MLLLDLPTLQMPVLHSDLSTHCARESPRTCLHYRVMCFTWTGFLHRALSCTWTRLDNTSLHVLLLDLSIYTKETCAAFTWTCLQYRVLCFTWTCLIYRGLSWTLMCPHYRVLCCTRCVYFTGPELHLVVSTPEGSVHLL